MKPRRPTIKDSTRNVHSKRTAEQVAARAARKAAAKKAKLEHPEEDVNQAAFKVMRKSTEN